MALDAQLTWQTLINSRLCLNRKHRLRCQISCENTAALTNTTHRADQWRREKRRLLRLSRETALQSCQMSKAAHKERRKEVWIGCEMFSAGGPCLLEISFRLDLFIGLLCGERWQSLTSRCDFLYILFYFKSKCIVWVKHLSEKSFN